MMITANANFHVTMVSFYFDRHRPNPVGAVFNGTGVGARFQSAPTAVAAAQVLFILHYCVWICKLISKIPCNER